MFAAGKTSSGVAAQTYVDDVFSTWLYTGTGATQTINNGIGLTSTAAWSAGKLQQNSSTGYGIATDSSGNVYVAGYATSSGSYASISKYNSSGVLQWQRSLQQNGSSCNAITTDSSGNVYATGYCNDGANNYAFIVKYNSSGTIQWQRKLSDTNGIGYGIDLDSSNNIYIVGTFGSVTRGYVAKYDNSGTIQWQRQFYQSGIGNGFAINIDSSDNIYVTGNASDGTTNWFFTAKYNTAGIIQWQRKLLETAGTGQGIATDTSGNVYVTGSSNDGTNAYALIAKYNSSGTIQWQRKFFQSNSFGHGISTDSSGNVYVTGYSVSDSNYAFVSKYNTSGTIQWQRKLKQGATYGRGIATNTSGNVYVAGYANDGTNNYISIVKLAQDGSTVSGTANGLTMTVGTATDSAGTATESAGTATESAGTATDSAGTATDSAGTATYTYGEQAAVTGSGGLVWVKGRSAATDHALYDTARGATFDLVSNSIDAQTTQATGLTAFNANGFSIGALAKLNTSSAIYTSWTFREAPKFFDVVTYTGDGVAGRTISHNLGSVPGMIIVKCRSDIGNWQVWHRSLSVTNTLTLNTTDAAGADSSFNSTAPTATVFTVGSNNDVNGNTKTYVAYLFAHDTSTDGLIQCGSFTTDGSGNATVNLGWEPQWLLFKRAVGGTSNWTLLDSMRGWPVGGNDSQLQANLSTNENPVANLSDPNATGFSVTGISVSSTYIYVAIRRPNKPPTLGTQVFMPTVYSSDNTDNRFLSTGILTDMAWFRRLAASGSGYEGMVVGDRLRGQPWLKTGVTAAEVTQADALDQQLVSAAEYGTAFSAMTGVWIGNNSGISVGSANINGNAGTNNSIVHAFKRAPGVFDEVCYTGTTAQQTVSHNLAVIPELIIAKVRGNIRDWVVYYGTLDKYLVLNSTAALATDAGYIVSTSTSNFVVGASETLLNENAENYVAYLFATKAGISKVFSYTGNGTSQTINCGFTTGARFVLIKRTDSTGDWYVWNSATGIVAGNDPHLSLNTTAAEVTTDDSVDTDSTGFIVNQLAATNVNVTSATYIGLAFA